MYKRLLCWPVGILQFSKQSYTAMIKLSQNKVVDVRAGRYLAVGRKLGQDKHHWVFMGKLGAKAIDVDKIDDMLRKGETGKLQLPGINYIEVSAFPTYVIFICPCPDMHGEVIPDKMIGLDVEEWQTLKDHLPALLQEMVDGLSPMHQEVLLLLYHFILVQKIEHTLAANCEGYTGHTRFQPWVKTVDMYVEQAQADVTAPRILQIYQRALEALNLAVPKPAVIAAAAETMFQQNPSSVVAEALKQTNTTPWAYEQVFYTLMD